MNSFTGEGIQTETGIPLLFQVRGYPPPLLKKIFFADLHDLGHERKKIKKSVKMTQFCPDPPPPSVKFHTFFFFE